MKIKPMLAFLVEEPFDHPDWIFEIKWDGYRALAEVRAEGVQLYSRNFISFNEKFSTIVKGLEGLEEGTVLDGEVVLLDKEGRSHFQLLQNFLHAHESAGALKYCVFDILFYRGKDLRALPLIERKKILKKVLARAPKVIFYSDHVFEQGVTFFKAATKRQLEGIIAKDGQSPYLSTRSKYWLKIKTHLRQEVVIGGYTAPRNSRKKFGALIVGVYQDGILMYSGHVGGGFNQNSLKEIHELLKPLIVPKSPFSMAIKTNEAATWVKPKLVCEVSFQEWTQDGLMRQPIFQGMRTDKLAKNVKREKSI